MEYNDNIFPTLEDYEKMAKAYSSALQQKGFVFVKLTEEDYSFLLDEIFEIYFKLRASYRFLNGFLDSNRFLDLTNSQIEELRDMFKYTKNRGFQVRVNRTKCFLNSISLESKLLYKLNELAQKSEQYDAISKLANDRLMLSIENYAVHGTFANTSNLSYN